MRILIIHTHYKEQGGEDSAVRNEELLLRRNGHETRMLIFDNSRFTLAKLFFLPFNILSFVRTLKAVSVFSPDIAHIHNLHFAASPSVIWALKRKSIPVIKTLHNYRLLCPSGILFHKDKIFLKSLGEPFPWSAVFSKAYKNSGLLTFWLGLSVWLHRQLGTWRLVDKYIVFTESGRKLFLRSYLQLRERQLVVKPNFSAICGTGAKGEVPPGEPLRQQHFLYVGRLSEEKGIRTLLEAFATNDLHLTIIGEGPLRREVANSVAGNPRIIWLGYGSRDLVERELKNCSALILPSICYEGMPISVIEAFSAGVAVISSRLGAMESMVLHNVNGLFFEAGNSPDLNIQLWIWKSLNQADRDNISRNARQTYTENYTPEKNMVSLSLIYDAAIHEKSQSTQHFGKYRLLH